MAVMLLDRISTAAEKVLACEIIRKHEPVSNLFRVIPNEEDEEQNRKQQNHFALLVNWMAARKPSR